MAKKDGSTKKSGLKTRKTARQHRQPKANVAAAATPGSCLTLARAGEPCPESHFCPKCIEPARKVL
jgi:hypothetical protein